MKIVINTCFGGFSLSEKAYEFMGLKWDSYGYGFNDDKKRMEPKLIKCIEKLGIEANGICANLRIVEIPNDINWELDDYDGAETIHERHRSWS